MWIVEHYNELDCEYGYDPGVTVIAKNLTKAEAKSIARGMNKRSHWSDYYIAEKESARY